MHFFYITIIILLLSIIAYILSTKSVEYRDWSIWIDDQHYTSVIHALPFIESNAKTIKELKEKNLIKWSEINRKYEINMEGK
jgi:hypothetical protein